MQVLEIHFWVFSKRTHFCENEKKKPKTNVDTDINLEKMKRMNAQSILY